MFFVLQFFGFGLEAESFGSFNVCQVLFIAVFNFIDMSYF